MHMSETINTKNLMTEGNFKRKIIAFAIPVFIGNLFQQFYNTADSLIVGNYLGSQSLAAVTSSGPIIYLLIGFFMGFSMGAGIVIARRIGAQNVELTSRSVHTAIAMGLVFSVVMTIFGVIFTPILLQWMNTPSDVIQEAIIYLRIYFIGCGALIMYNTGVGILQASGDSKHPLYYLILSSCVNIVLDIIFIANFHMGVEGAALATIISEVISAILVLNKLMRTSEAIHLDIKKISFNHDDLSSIVFYGLPTALQASVIDLGNILVQSYFNSFGTLAMAGVGIHNKIEGFSFLPVTSFSIAISTFVSQNLGARKKDRMREGVRFGTILCTIMVEIIGILFYLFSSQLISAFDTNPEVIRYGVLYTSISAPFYFLMGYSHVTSAVMRGAGKPRVPMFVMLFCWCAVRVITLLTIGQIIHDIRLAFWLYPFTWFLSAASYFIYKRYLHKHDIL